MCTKSIVFIFKPLLRSKTECLIQCFAHIDFTWAGYTSILWWHIFVFITIIILFLSAWENATIGDRLTIGQSPLALHVWYGCARERSTPPQTTSSVSHTFIYLCRAASTACHQLPRDFSTIFSNFQTFLAAFFHNRYILTTLAALKIT